MMNRTRIREKLGHVFVNQQAEVLSEVIYDSYNALVRADDFNELKGIVKELAEAQQRTEQRVEDLAESQQHLVEAQQRTEQRVEDLAESQQHLVEAQQRTEQRVEDLAESQQHLAEAQQRTEQRVEDLAKAQQHLAEAQQRTEQRVEELAESQQHLVEAQQRTEQRVEDLAESQQHTEHALQQLARQMGGLARQVGGMSDRMGGDLEEVAAIMVHDVLERELGWQIDELDRAWQMWNGEEEEIDVFGQAHDPLRPDTTLWIVGEVKFNLTIRDVECFTFLLARAAGHLEGEIVPVCFSYRVRPSVREATKMAGYYLVLSNGRMM